MIENMLREMLHGAAIVVLSVVACVTYGVLHDQVTARISVEYFTIGHPRVIASEDPTILALAWGVIATWWVGVILGVPLAIACRAGGRPKLPPHAVLPPIAILFALNALFAVFAGAFGYFAASQGYVRLIGRLAERVPPEKHVPFLVDLWAHNASYLGGFFGGIVVVVYFWRSRGKITKSS